MYVSLLFWLTLALPGYVVVRHVFKDDLESGLLGVIGLSYLATFGLLSPISIACYLLHAPLWVFSTACVTLVVAAAIEITRRGWWHETGKLVRAGLCFELLIVAVDAVLGARVGAVVWGDAVVHLARVRVLMDHGFNNYDPFVAGGYFFPIYHTNILHALFAACSQLTGVHSAAVWFVSLAWGKLLIASGAYYLAWCAFGRNWVGWVAAVFTVGCQGPVRFIVYPNKLAPLWILAMMIGFAIQACQARCTWKSPAKLGLGSLAVAQVHALYGAFAGVALGPTLACIGLVRIFRRHPDGWWLAACTVVLTIGLPFLLVSKATSSPRSGPSRSVQTPAIEDGEAPQEGQVATEVVESQGPKRGRVTMGPTAGWGTVRGWRAACLGAGIICALAGSRRKQAALLLAIAGTVALIFYIPPLCAAALRLFEQKWVLGRMGLVLHLGSMGLMLGSVTFLIEPLTRLGWLRWMLSALASRPTAARAKRRHSSKREERNRRAGPPEAFRLEGVAYRAVFSILALLFGIAFVDHKEPYTWPSYLSKAVAPRDQRHERLDNTHACAAFYQANIPRGAIVLIGGPQGMALTMVHDCYIVAPERGGNGIPDWGQRREDLNTMLAPDTPWGTRSALLRQYGVTHLIPSGESIEWVRGHIKKHPTDRRFPLYVLDTDR